MKNFRLENEKESQSERRLKTKYPTKMRVETRFIQFKEQTTDTMVKSKKKRKKKRTKTENEYEMKN